MKLTKVQRFVAYCIILHEIEYGCETWMCNAFFHVFGIDLDEYHMRDVLPELWDKRPVQSNSKIIGSWFGDEEDGREKRIKALMQCISETYQ